MKAIMTVIGADCIGIVAQVSTLLAAMKVNILDMSQTIMDGLFTMTMLVDTEKSEQKLEDIRSKGVDENFLPKIFDRFYRLDTDRNRNLSSSGLGLSIVKEAVSLHGHTIKAKNHPKGGLQFIFRL